MPITKSNVRDARPQINADAESEKKLFSATVARGTIEIKRGEGRSIALAIKYEEVQELSDLLGELIPLVNDNQYDASGSLKDGYQPGNARYVAPSRQKPAAEAPTEGPFAGDTPSQSGVVSAATQGTGTDVPAATDADAPHEENTIQPELASQPAETAAPEVSQPTEAQQAQAAFDAEPSRTEPVDQSNPFGTDS